MRKLATLFILAALLQGTGDMIGGLVKTATFQNGQSSTQIARPSWAEHMALVQEGSDPSGFAVSG